MKQQSYVCGPGVHKNNVYAAIYNGKDRSEVQVFATFTEHSSNGPYKARKKGFFVLLFSADTNPLSPQRLTQNKNTGFN